MIDWPSIPDVEWSTKGNTQLATELGCSPQNVAAARKRYDKPASPEQRGGDRKTAGRDPNAPTTLVIETTHGHRLAWIEAARRAEMKVVDWAAAQLDAAAKI